MNDEMVERGFNALHSCVGFAVLWPLYLLGWLVTKFKAGRKP